MVLGHSSAHDAIYQNTRVEVHEQPHWLARKLEIRKQLCLVDGKHLLHRLQFDDDDAINQQVQALPAINAHTVVDDWDFNLPLDAMPALDKLVVQTGLVRRFEESGSQCTMDRNRCADHAASKGIVFVCVR